MSSIRAVNLPGAEQAVIFSVGMFLLSVDTVL